MRRAAVIWWCEKKKLVGLRPPGPRVGPKGQKSWDFSKCAPNGTPELVKTRYIIENPLKINQKINKNTFIYLFIQCDFFIGAWNRVLVSYPWNRVWNRVWNRKYETGSKKTNVSSKTTNSGFWFQTLKPGLKPGMKPRLVSGSQKNFVPHPNII